MERKSRKVNNDITSPLWIMEAYLDVTYSNEDMKTYGVIRRLAVNLGMNVEAEGLNHICTWKQPGKWSGTYDD